jgi:hypothetical protein
MIHKNSITVRIHSKFMANVIIFANTQTDIHYSYMCPQLNSLLPGARTCIFYKILCACTPGHNLFNEDNVN